MRATIHQPDFMPWFGFFNKIAKAQVWVLLDHVENNPRDAAFWGRRVRVLINGEPSWLSIPLNRPADGAVGIPIRDMTINQSDPRVLEKCLRTVQMAYARAPFFAEHFHLAESYFRDSDPSLLNRNMRFIRAVMELLDIRTEVTSSSLLGATSRKTQLLVDLLKSVGADTYVCGGGADGYQEDDLFVANAIELRYNRFEHPTYPQLRAAAFVPGLSILDMLFSVPLDRVREWVHAR